MYFELKSLFSYPAVEYIPITIHTKALGQLPEGRAKGNAPTLLISSDASEFLKRIDDSYGIRIEPEVTAEPDELLILALNMKIMDIKYRASKVIMIGRYAEKTFHLFKITNRYFYKEQLLFEVYDTAENRLTFQNFTVVKSPPERRYMGGRYRKTH